jgi:hypothetical protein
MVTNLDGHVVGRLALSAASGENSDYLFAEKWKIWIGCFCLLVGI